MNEEIHARPDQQGKYVNGSYDGDSLSISTQMMSVNNAIQTIKRTNDVEVELYRWDDVELKWYKVRDYLLTNTIVIYLYDINDTLISQYALTLNTEYQISNSESNAKAVSAIVTFTISNHEVVNANIHPASPTPQDIPTGLGFWYSLKAGAAIYIDYNYNQWIIGVTPHSHFEYANRFEPKYTSPPPKAMWRVNPSYNSGRPYNALMRNIPYVVRIPSISQGETTEITDTSSIEYKRYSTTGYTNPDLIRFRDKEFAENVSQKVFIKGVNSYRYTEVDDYEDGSTTSEIP